MRRSNPPGSPHGRLYDDSTTTAFRVRMLPVSSKSPRPSHRDDDGWPVGRAKSLRNHDARVTDLASRELSLTLRDVTVTP